MLSAFRSAFRTPHSALVSRRDWLRRSSAGFGMLALRGLLGDPAFGAEVAPAPRPAKARGVIFCFMDGGPSHVDTFDPKPALATHSGKPIGQSAVSKRSQSDATRVWMPSPWAFEKRGRSGLPVSTLLPHIAGVADELCVVRSMVGEQPLHGQQNLLLHTGRVTGGAPSFGSWVTYGLGSGSKNLPGYVLLNNDWVPNGGLENFAAAYLPADTQATVLRAKGTPLDNIAPSDRAAVQRRKLDLLRDQDAAFAAGGAGADVVEGAIRNYEAAFRMQTAIPDVADVSRETAETQALYGLDSKNDYQKHYGLQCLRARRLVESGVRFVEITCPLTHPNNSPWDQHGQLKKYHEENALITDRAVAALITDLKRRGLLDSTVVLWAGEMGRTPHTPRISPEAGRDHHVNGYSLVLAGGGFKGGTTYGATDEFGNAVVENQLAVHDVHATILHQLGFDHTKLTFRFGGRDHRLTDVHGRVVRELLG
ncbi:MAG: hypothetical protein JWO38_2628 [Gemmataceae bacterium]|nr:hypothetical protein [Gemmataceae bacterium]